MSGSKTQFLKYTFLAWSVAVVVVTAACLSRESVRGETESDPSELPNQITISADISHEWKNEKAAVFLLRGHCRIEQGETRLQAQKMVVWRWAEKTGRGTVDHVGVYLEDDVRIDRPEKSLNVSSTYISLETRDGVGLSFLRRLSVEPNRQDGLFQRALLRRRESRREELLHTQLVVDDQSASGPEFQTLPLQPQQSMVRRVRLFPRDVVPYNFISFESNETTPPEQVWILTGGIRLIVDGLDKYKTVDLASDRMVIWTQSAGENGFRADPGETLQSSDTPLTVYLEGHIVIRQGQHVINATHATFDAREDRGLYHNVQLRTSIPRFQGDLRIRAERVRQLSASTFHAQRASATGSKFAIPGYRMRSSDIWLEDRYTNSWFGSQTTQFDPETGIPILEPTPWITSRNNTFLVEEIPILYSPYLSAPAEDPNVPLRRASAGYDRINGLELETAWDLFKLLGIEEPDGTSWHLLADYFSKRGPGIGTWGKYRGNEVFSDSDKFRGEGLLYYIQDNGEDNLGTGRRTLEPEVNDRYRAQWRHRHELPDGVKIFGELGLLSDRNFLEQYYENEFDEEKDVETLVSVQQTIDNWTLSVLGRPRVNNFTTTTEWLPRGDLFGLSEPILGGWLTWSSHTSAGYANLRPGDAPTDPADIYTPLPYVANIDGAVLMSRHELDAPFDLGPVHLVPYALGEAAFWSEDFTSDELDRFVGSAGLRSSLMFWRAFPYLQSRVFNLNGLAHKVILEADYSFTDSTESLASIPQYNEFDDNAQERFRSRFLTNTFGGVLPAVFEPRFYAVRTGAARSVSSPYHELIDEQQVARFAVRQRLQTKEGPPDRLRIKDWMTFDFEASYFPDADRDNFGEELGLIGGRYRWNVGSRTSILANAYYDLFDNAQELWNIGVLSQRSQRGSLYFGVRQIKGFGLDSQILSTSFSYQMSEKWVTTFGTGYDLGENRNSGQSWTVTRIGADFNIHMGASFDESKDNAGIAIAIEPRFIPTKGGPTQIDSLLGGPQRNR